MKEKRIDTVTVGWIVACVLAFLTLSFILIEIL